MALTKELIEQYRKDTGRDMTYEPERIITVEGHDVAWMKYTGKIITDLSGQGREGQPFEGHSLFCECDFTPGIGYEIKVSKKTGEPQIYSLDGEKRCLPRQVAQHLRCLELRKEYKDRFEGDDAWFSMHSHKTIEKIIFDLIEKAKREEFIGEDSGGARFWGGYFYLQTVAEITDTYIGHLWEDVYQMVREKKIGLEGAVIQPYTEAPPPDWEEYAKIEDEGWIGIAYLPAHRQMAKEWKLEVLNPEGKSAYRLIPGIRLLHDPVFGPDVEDVNNAEKALSGLIADAKEGKKEDEGARS